MFDNAAKDLWFRDNVRRNLLEPKPVRRPSRPAETDEEEQGGAIPSQRTHQLIDAFFAAQEAGDKDDLARTLNEVIQSWRADNAAGGVPVHGHLPLPSQFAEMVSERLAGLPAAKRGNGLETMLASSDPGARTMTGQQIREVLSTRQAPRHVALGSAPQQIELDADHLRREIDNDRREIDVAGSSAPSANPMDRFAKRASFQMQPEPRATAGVEYQTDAARPPVSQPARNPRQTPQSPDLPYASKAELGNDKPVRFTWYAQPPEVAPDVNGMICRRGVCKPAWDRNETDKGMSDDLRVFELRIIRRLYGAKATRAWMKSNELDYHAYRNTTRFRAPPGTTLAQVQSALRLWAAPQYAYDKPQRSRPVESGDESELSIDHGVIFPFADTRKLLGGGIDMPGGMVTHYVDPQTGALANVTQPNHRLYPGYILRWVEQLPDGSFVLHTLGRGLGFHARLNEQAGARMFTDVDDAVVSTLSGSIIE